MLSGRFITSLSFEMFFENFFELKKGEIVSDIKNIFCKYCNEAFYTERAVNIHIMTYHDEEKERKSKKKKVEMDEGRVQRTKTSLRTLTRTCLIVNRTGAVQSPDQDRYFDLYLKMRKLEPKKSWPGPQPILLHVTTVIKDLPIFLE